MKHKRAAKGCAKDTLPGKGILEQPPAVCGDHLKTGRGGQEGVCLERLVFLNPKPKTALT